MELKTEGATGSTSRDGVIQETIVYHVDDVGLVLTVGKQPPQGLEETTRSWTAMNVNESTYYTVTVNYEGGSTNGGSQNNSEEDMYWSYDYNLLEEPIESHWDIDAIKEKYGGYTDPNDDTRWIFAEFEKGKEEEKIPSPMAGVRTYMVLHLTVSKNYSSKNLPSGILSNAGKPVKSVQGVEIDIGDREWLTMPAKATKRGSVWQISESWKLSEKVKWPEEVYGSKFTIG